MNTTIIFRTALSAFITLFSLSAVHAQKTYLAKDFFTLKEYTDPNDSTKYEIGRFEPATFNIVKDEYSDLRTYQATNATHDFEKKIYDGKNATAFLKKKRSISPPVFPLNVYSNLNDLQFSDLKSEKLLVLSDRYAFYVYNKMEDRISPRITPSLGSKKWEDGISGTISALTLFSNDEFILGSAQNNGAFAYYIADVSSPNPLLSYNNNKKNTYIVFLNHRKDGLYDVITALIDSNSESKNVKGQYHKFKDIQFAAKGQTIQLKNDGSPLVSLNGNRLILNNNSKTAIDLKTGKANF